MVVGTEYVGSGEGRPAGGRLELGLTGLSQERVSDSDRQEVREPASGRA